MRLNNDNNIGVLPQPKADVAKTRPKADNAYQSSSPRSETSFADMLGADKSSETRPTKNSESPKKAAAPSRNTQAERPEREQNPSENRDAESAQSSAPTQKPVKRDQNTQTEPTRSTTEINPTNHNEVSKASATPEKQSTEQTPATVPMKGQSAVVQQTEGKPISMAELKAIRQNLADQGLLNEQLPVLSLIGGRVDQLDPVQIPELMGNEFLANALTVPEVKKYLETPRSMDGLLNEMDAGQEILEVLEQAGVDISAFITPRQIIDALGVDPNRALSEINQLRQSLKETPDLSIYMAIAAKGKIHASNAGGPLQKNVSDDPTSPGAVASAWDKNRTSDERAPATKEAKPSPTVGSIVSPQIGASAPSTSAAQPMRSASVDASPKVRSRTSATDSVETQQNAIDSANAPALGTSATELIDGSVPQTAANTTAAGSLASKVVVTDEVVRPTARVVSYDPFTAMTVVPVERDVVAKDSVEVSSDVAANVEETLTDKFAADAVQLPKANDAANYESNDFSNVVLTDATTPITAMLRPEAATLTKTSAVAQMQMNSALSEVDSQELEQVLAEEEAQLESADLNQSMAAPERADVLAVTVPTEAGTTDNRSGTEERTSELSRHEVLGFDSISTTDSNRGNQDFSSNDSDRRKDEPMGEAPVEAMLGQVGVGGQEFKVGMQEQAPSVQEVRHAEQMSKIFEKAEMMVQNGGGTIKLEIGGEGNEKIEIAVRVFGDKVDLKITTGNDQLRDMLNSGLPKLRESFANRNLLLEQVNVGVNAGQSWENSSQQNFERWQQARDTMNIAASSSSYGNVRSESSPIRPYRSWGGQLRHHTGQIQVAV
jgi:hypothetical protein